MCLDFVRCDVGPCGKPYSPSESRCQVKVLVGMDGKPNGETRCPHRWLWCSGEAGKI